MVFRLSASQVSMQAAVRFESVTKSFPGRRAVDALSFSIPQGSLYGFIGPNGSGKTTSLRMMLRIIYPDQGQITILGQGQYQAASDHSGYLPEERGLYRRMRVEEVLRFHAELKNVRRPQARIAHWLERLGLGDRARMRVSSLSKGLAQRVQFAAAVVHDPKLLVLDEPFSGLDPVSLDALREIILELKSSGTTVVLSTHDMHMAERLCDAVLMLHEGRKVLDGPIEQIKRERGLESVRVSFEHNLDLVRLPEITRARHYGREQVLELSPETDTQALLGKLMSLGRVLSFAVVRPSLHELFVDIAGKPSTNQPDQTGVVEAHGSS